jgi:hypothetical protein
MTTTTKSASAWNLYVVILSDFFFPSFIGGFAASGAVGAGRFKEPRIVDASGVIVDITKAQRYSTARMRYDMWDLGNMILTTLAHYSNSDLIP